MQKQCKRATKQCARTHTTHGTCHLLFRQAWSNPSHTPPLIFFLFCPHCSPRSCPSLSLSAGPRAICVRKRTRLHQGINADRKLQSSVSEELAGMEAPYSFELFMFHVENLCVCLS